MNDIEKVIDEVANDLVWWRDTNEEKGVVYIPLYNIESAIESLCDIVLPLRELQEQNKWHLVADNDFPTDLEIVNVVWCNHNPPSYYQNIKDKRFVASAVYFKGKWYWYSSTCIDYLDEYGKNDFDLIDEDVEVIAWRELPKFESEE